MRLPVPRSCSLSALCVWLCSEPVRPRPANLESIGGDSRCLPRPPQPEPMHWGGRARGAILFLINRADVVFGGLATGTTWTKIGLSYLIPFFVSNYGIVVASRRSGSR